VAAEDEATTPAGRREPVADKDVTEGIGADYYQDGEETREAMFEKLLRRKDDSHRYVILQDVAEGGMGKVYMVKDQDLIRANVMKVMKPKLASNPQLFQSFVDEARITAQLEHPNIVPVHDLGVFGGDKLFFTMKLVEGEELALVLGSLRRDDEEYVKKYTLYHMLTVFRKVCDGVAYAHSKGIIAI
jgi:serine/threonine protein kinase